MKKNYLLLIILFAGLIPVVASEPVNLEDINREARALFIKPEKLDMLMIQLRTIQKDVPSGQEQLLMNTYKIIADQYSANNHYGQAYSVYLAYLDYKKSWFVKVRKNSLDSLQASVALRKQQDEMEIMNQNNQVEQLSVDIDQLSNKHGRFRKFFSFGILALSVLFASLLVKSGLTMNTIRVRLKEDREKMKSMQRISVLGWFVSGCIHSFRTRMEGIIRSSSDIVRKLKEQNISRPAIEKCAVDLKKEAEEVTSSLSST